MRCPLAPLATALWLAVLVACETPGDPQPSPAPKTEPSEPPQDAPASSAATRWLELGSRTEHEFLQAPAVVRAGAEARAEIATSVRAQVRRVHVRAGDVVDEGDEMLDVSAPAWSNAAADYAGTTAQLAVHEARTEELRGLREQGLVGREAVFQQQAKVADLKARRARAAATLRAGGLSAAQRRRLAREGVVTLVAPVNGVVTEVNAHPGQIREAGGAPFAHILGRAPAHVEVRTVEPWPEGAKATFSGANDRHLALADEPLSQVVDRHDGTYLSWFAFAEVPRELPDGLRGVVRAEAPADAWRVPATAVARHDGEVFVRRQRGGTTQDVAVDVLFGDGAAAWIRAVQDGALREGDGVAAEAERILEAPP